MLELPSHVSSPHLRRILWLVLAFALLVPGLASGSRQEVALGPSGEIYRVRIGAYGDLFSGDETDTENVVLALDVTHPDGSSERHLIPDTERSDVESSPSLVLEQTSQTLYVVWESTFNYIHSGIHLVGFHIGPDAASWSEVIEVSGDTFSWKTAPQLAITRDTLTLPDSRGVFLVPYERTVFHTVWWEQAGVGPRVIYAPIVLVNGAYIGWNPVYVLTDLAAQTNPGQGVATVEIAENLHRSPTIDAGRDLQSVVAALTDPGTGELVSFEIRVVPGELSHLAADARAHIIDIGAFSCAGNRDTITSLADVARAHIIDIGARFHTGVLNYLAAEARAHIIDIGARSCARGGVTSLAAKTSEHLLDVGTELLDKGLRNLGGPARAHIIDIGFGVNAEAPFAQHIDIRPVSRRAAPQVGDGSTRVFLSPTGTNILVAWEEDGSILYRESQGQGFSRVLSLKLTDSLSNEQAYRVLRQRIRDR